MPLLCHVALLWLAPLQTAPAGISADGWFALVLDKVEQNYAFPKRMKPRVMFHAGLDALSKAYPEIKVTASPLALATASGAVTLDEPQSLAELVAGADRVRTHLKSAAPPAGRDPDAPLYTFMNGMLAALDPHTMVLTPAQAAEMRVNTTSQFGGLGIVVHLKEGVLYVVKVVRGREGSPTPALTAGLLAGDRIEAIDDVATAGKPLEDLVAKMRGPVGSTVTLVVARTAWPVPRRLTLARATIQISSAESTLLEGNVGYVVINSLSGTSATDAALELKRLQDFAGGPLAGLVLDLRTCPGGLLEQAVKLSDWFLERGTIATTSSAGKTSDTYTARAGDGAEQTPLAVLVSETTASGCEIIAGALKWNDRATLLGRRTWGKGSLQVLYELPAGAQLKITVGEHRPGGTNSIDQIGIDPDIELTPAAGPPDPPPFRTLPEREKPLAAWRYADTPAHRNDELVIDAPIETARDLLRSAPRLRRSDMLAAAASFLAARGKLAAGAASKPVAAAATPAPSPAEGAPRKLNKPVSVLVLELKPVGQVPKRVAQLVTRLLLSDLDTVEGLRTVGTDDIDAMLDVQRKKDLAGCDSTTCLAEIGGALGAQLVLHGQLGVLGKRYNINVTLVDSSQSAVRGRVSWLVDANEDTIADRLPELTSRIVDKLNAATP